MRVSSPYIYLSLRCELLPVSQGEVMDHRSIQIARGIRITTLRGAMHPESGPVDDAQENVAD